MAALTADGVGKAARMALRGRTWNRLMSGSSSRGNDGAAIGVPENVQPSWHERAGLSDEGGPKGGGGDEDIVAPGHCPCKTSS